MPRITSVSANFENCLAIATEGRVFEQRRAGSKITWHKVSLDGLGGKAVKTVHHSPDGRILYALCSDMSLWMHEPTGGNRYAVERTWRPVEFTEPVEL
jgi:hypothetical protein